MHYTRRPCACLTSRVHLYLTRTHLLTLCPHLNHLLTCALQPQKYPYRSFVLPHSAFCLAYHIPILNPSCFPASSSRPPVLRTPPCPSLTHQTLHPRSRPSMSNSNHRYPRSTMTTWTSSARARARPYCCATLTTLRKAYVVIFTTCCGVFDAVKITTSCGDFY